MMKLLVTAFDPFGGESINPALLALDALPSVIGNCTLEKLQVPTSFSRAGQVVCQAIDSLQPQAVLCLGQAGGRSAITIERVAINVMDASLADNDGFTPCDLPIVADAPDGYFSTLPIRQMLDAIHKTEIPAQISNTAGTFVCNTLLYTVLHHATNLNVSCGFIHLPYLPQQVLNRPTAPSMSLENIVTGLTAAISAIG